MGITCYLYNLAKVSISKKNLSSLVDRGIKKPERGSGYELLLLGDSRECEAFLQ
jgi:hypothetical protein